MRYRFLQKNAFSATPVEISGKQRDCGLHGQNINGQQGEK